MKRSTHRLNRSPKEVAIYTDGACLGNPGPGGYSAILVHGKHELELSGGFRLTTNNRMELIGAIAGLRGLKLPCTVTVFSDSRYVVNPMRTGLVLKWKANDWMRNRKDKVLNVDLWEQLIDLSTQHSASFEWLRGHRGHELNERCDRIAVGAANQPDLKADEVYERDHPQTPSVSAAAESYVEAHAQRPDDPTARKIIAVMDACRDDSSAKTVQYDDSEGFQIYASTSQVAWRYRFRNLDHAYAMIQAGSGVRAYRTEM